MSRNPLLALLSTLAVAAAGSASVAAPSVAVDIAPVHALVARVMLGVGTPDLVIPAGASPHGYSLRPSEAQALQSADVVVWIGPELTPWLADTIGTLAGDAEALDLLEVPGTTVLDIRDGARFEPDHHEELATDHADHDEDDLAHADEDQEGGHEHARGGVDPHVWLAPANASVWLDAIAARLSAADRDNAGAYFANAAAGKAELDVLAAEIDGILDPVRGRSFIVFHDAYQYFETAFDVPASGSISLSDAIRPSPARIGEIHDLVAKAGVSCVLAEPQFNPDLVATVLDGTDARSGVLDPLGSDLAPGPALYPQLMRNLARTLAGCL